MRSNLQNEDQINEYQNFNKNFGDVYNQLGSIHQQEQQMEEMDMMQDISMGSAPMSKKSANKKMKTK